MKSATRKTLPRRQQSAADRVRQRIEQGSEAYWRQQDFASLPSPAVSQTLSRLTKQGILQRVRKGLYYRPRATAFGTSRPSDNAIQQLQLTNKVVFPAGLSAANLLGFTTQNPMHSQLATPESSLPRTIIGRSARVFTRRPDAWRQLSTREAALLDFLRNRGAASELTPEETLQRLLRHFREAETFERLAGVALTEPPRVRAILGAIGQQLGKRQTLLGYLRAGLNPLSRFDFGILSGLRYAFAWQAKEQSTR